MFRALKSPLTKKKVQSYVGIIIMTRKLKKKTRKKTRSKKSRRKKFKVSKACKNILVPCLVSYEAAPQVGYLYRKICNQVKLVDFTSPSKVGFLDDNLLRMFGESNEVGFG